MRAWSTELLMALAQQVGDIEVSMLPGPDGTARVEMRVDSAVISTGALSRNVYPWLLSHLKKLARLDVAEKQEPQSGEIHLTAPDSRILVVETELVGSREALRLRNYWK
jgi:type II secretory ATPase GspE/PulE/Tfp pilus assembly ATPase PilB-like protein